MSPGWKQSRFTQDVVKRNRFTHSLLCFRLTMKGVKLAGSGVAFYLLIPIIILKGMKQSLQLTTLFQ